MGERHKSWDEFRARRMGSAEAQAGCEAEARASGCTKEAVRRIIERLPDDASLEDITDALYFRPRKEKRL